MPHMGEYFETPKGFQHYDPVWEAWEVKRRLSELCEQLRERLPWDALPEFNRGCARIQREIADLIERRLRRIEKAVKGKCFKFDAWLWNLYDSVVECTERALGDFIACCLS